MIEHLCFFVTRITHILLCLEALCLIDRIIQFTVPLPNFASCDDRLELLNNTPPRRKLCERRHFHGNIDKESWATQLFATILPECVGCADTVPSLLIILNRKTLECCLYFFECRSIDINISEFFDGLTIIITLPRSSEVNFEFSDSELQCSECLLRNMLIEILHQDHSVFVICICPIQFELCVVLRMLGRHSLVTENTTDLKDFIVSRNHESLLPQLSTGDAKEYIEIKRIVVRFEWARISTTSSIFNDGRFNFKETLLEQE